LEERYLQPSHSFALLGYCTLYGHPANQPRCTGAVRSAILGQITPGGNYESLMWRVFAGGEACLPIRKLRSPR
jgi:hypothetical protein